MNITRCTAKQECIIRGMNGTGSETPGLARCPRLRVFAQRTQVDVFNVVHDSVEREIVYQRLHSRIVNVNGH